jgi:nicotinate-nucleotide adenylyltransferase
VKIGVFGGSFDPPHVGHLAVAQDALESMGLDLMYFVPARLSPFKTDRPGTDPGIRSALLESALAGHPSMRVWRGELERPAPSFTVNTLEELRGAHPGAELFLFMGTDQWASFRDWKDPERIAGLATLCVIGRRGDADPGVDGFEARSVTTRRMDVSSTEVRARVAAGRSIRFLVPESVRRGIEQHQLYGEREVRSASPLT